MVKENFYEFLEHTADLGIKVRARNLREIFKNTAKALFEIIAERISDKRPKKINKIQIKQNADNLEELFINWLNELLSLSAVKRLVFFDFKIKKLRQNCLEAEVIGEDIKNYKVKTEIKAATYHQLKIEKKNNFYFAEVIFDV